MEGFADEIVFFLYLLLVDIFSLNGLFKITSSFIHVAHGEPVGHDNIEDDQLPASLGPLPRELLELADKGEVKRDEAG